ncbi:MAG: hypothetical protein ABIQ90_03000 [Polaromonas sp.]
MARIHERRGGMDYDSNFAMRMVDEGSWADLVHRRFQNTCQPLGFNRQRTALDLSQFRPPGAVRQASLF